MVHAAAPSSAGADWRAIASPSIHFSTAPGENPSAGGANPRYAKALGTMPAAAAQADHVGSLLLGVCPRTPVRPACQNSPPRTSGGRSAISNTWSRLVATTRAMPRDATARAKPPPRGGRRGEPWTKPYEPERPTPAACRQTQRDASTDTAGASSSHKS